MIWPCRIPIDFVDHLDDGRQAIGRAGCGRQQPMPGRVVEVIVDADDDVERGRILDGGRNDYPLYSAVEIGLKLVWLEEFARALQHDIAAEIAPRRRRLA